MGARRLERLDAGMPIPYGGDRVATVSAELAAAFQPGDRLLVVQETGDLLHLPAADVDRARVAVDRAEAAFAAMGGITDDHIDAFYGAFADALADDARFEPIARANRLDVEQAQARGRSTTRLVLSEEMRRGMIDGLRGWRETPSRRGEVVGVIEHDGWRLERIIDRLGVVGFVFEGRPNVFADACGVLRSGNTVVFRIGSDALGTARAIVEHALDPALEAAGLPPGAASLVDSPSHAAGWAMFADQRLALAVARGSGQAVRQLGAVAAQSGNDVSLHGTGGAWLVAGPNASSDRLAAVIEHSLDRKVCNTLNTCLVVAQRADELVPVVLDALQRAADRREVAAKLHVLRGSEAHVPDVWFQRHVPIARAEGRIEEPQAELQDPEELGREWEWEQSPELTLGVVGSVDEAVGLFNHHSPRFVASLVDDDPEAQGRFFAAIDAPYVGDGFTRWVDGQYALGTPELGLSNWERGRLFGRGGILSGDSVFTVRYRAVQHDPAVHR